MSLVCRLARHDDLPVLQALMERAIDSLQRAYLSDGQVAASHSIMGLDTQLIDDGTYFVVEIDGQVAGCGGWSRRATRYGGDHTGGRDDRLLEPGREPARVRAMYTDPTFVRRGVGSAILERCERAAADEGFGHLELVATLAGEPLYRNAGFRVVENLTDDSSGAAIPLRTMTKPIEPT